MKTKYSIAVSASGGRVIAVRKVFRFQKKSSGNQIGRREGWVKIGLKASPVTWAIPLRSLGTYEGFKISN